MFFIWEMRSTGSPLEAETGSEVVPVARRLGCRFSLRGGDSIWGSLLSEEIGALLENSLCYDYDPINKTSFLWSLFVFPCFPASSIRLDRSPNALVYTFHVKVIFTPIEHRWRAVLVSQTNVHFRTLRLPYQEEIMRWAYFALKCLASDCNWRLGGRMVSLYLVACRFLKNCAIIDMIRNKITSLLLDLKSELDFKISLIVC